jgi:predicted kinase
MGKPWPQWRKDRVKQERERREQFLQEVRKKIEQARALRLLRPRRKRKILAWGTTGRFIVTTGGKNGGEGNSIYDTHDEALAAMLKYQQQASVVRVHLAPQVWVRTREAWEHKWGNSPQGKTCQSPYRVLTEAKLLEGHSVLCVSWHLRRLNWPTMWMRLANHWHKHLTMFRDPSWGIPPLWLHTMGVTPRIVFDRPPETPPWLYTPYPPPTTPPQPSLVLIRGVMGSGKSELAHTYGLTHRHLEADQYFFTHDGWFQYNERSREDSHTWCEAMTRRCLEQGESVVVANTFYLNEGMLPYLECAEDYNVPVIIKDIVPGTDLSPRQLHHNIQQNRLARQLRHWEPCTVQQKRWRVPVSYHEFPMTDDRLAVPDVPYVCQPGTCTKNEGYERFAPSDLVTLSL